MTFFYDTRRGQGMHPWRRAWRGQYKTSDDKKNYPCLVLEWNHFPFL